MRFQQAPYRIADVVALLFILHGNTSFGSLAPIIPYRSCKHYLERTETQYVYSGALNRTYKYIIEYYRCADCGYTYPVTIDCGWFSGEVVGW